MDVLQIIKQDHTDILASLGQLDAQTTLKARRAVVNQCNEELLLHLHLEASYVFPEACELSSEAKTFISIGLANHALLRKDLQKLMKLVEQSLAAQDDYNRLCEDLLSKVQKHFALEEELLLPQMRKLIATQDREDFGLVVQDAKLEAPLAAAKSTTQGRKRA